MVKYSYTVLARGYAEAFLKFLDEKGSVTPEEDYRLLKESLEDILKVYRLKRYTESIGKCSRYLRRSVKATYKSVSLEERVKLIELSLAYYVANTYIGGIGKVQFFKVSVLDDDVLPGVSFVAGSNLPIDKVKDMLENLFPKGFSYSRVEGAGEFVMITSINSSKINYRGMSGIVYVESSDKEAKLTLKNVLKNVA